MPRLHAVERKKNKDGTKTNGFHTIFFFHFHCVVQGNNPITLRLDNWLMLLPVSFLAATTSCHHLWTRSYIILWLSFLPQCALCNVNNTLEPQCHVFFIQCIPCFLHENHPTAALLLALSLITITLPSSHPQLEAQSKAQSGSYNPVQTPAFQESFPPAPSNLSPSMQSTSSYIHMHTKLVK